jgi:uncharacterized protein (DUF1330 family)
MKARYQFGLAAAAFVIAIGAAKIGELRAQAKPAAYVVIDISEMKDADAYIKAVSAAEPQATESAGGRFIIRTNAPVGLDGTPPNRFVLIGFDNAERAKAWYQIEAIKKINAVRMQVSRSRAFMVEALTK